MSDATARRINDLHREHRAAYLRKEELERRGLDYTTAYQEVIDTITFVEASLSVLVPGK